MNRLQTPRAFFRRLFIASSALALAASPASAASSTWTNNTANSTWVTGSNWSGSIIPGAGTGTTNTDTATFGIAITGARTVTVDPTRNIQNIVFDNNAATTLTGGSLLLTNGGTVSYTGTSILAARQTIASEVILQGDGGSYTFSSNPANSRGLFVSGSIRGVSTGVNVTTLNLTGANISTSTQGDVLAGLVTDGTNGGKLALNKTGVGLWFLTRNNTFSGGSTISAGTLRAFDNSTTLVGSGSVVNNGLGTGGVTLNGGTLSFQIEGDGTATAQSITYGNNVSVTANSTISVQNVATDSNKTIVLGNLSIGANSLITSGAQGYGVRVGTVTANGSGTINATTATMTMGSLTVGNSVASSSTTAVLLTSTISGNGITGVVSDNSVDSTKRLSLVKSGVGTWALSSSNTYTGGTAINGGILNIVNGALGASGAVSFGGGTLQYASGATQDLSARIAGSGSAIAIDTNGNDVTFATTLANTNTGGLTKTGSGMLILNGVHSYSGTTSVLGGGISVNNSAWSGSGSVLLLSSGSFRTTNAITFNSPGGANYHLINLGAGGGTFDINGGTLTVGPAISGSGNLTKIGSGTMQVNAANSFTGTLNLNAGALHVIASNRFSTAAAVTFDGGALNLQNSGQGNQTNSNAIILNSGGGVIRVLGTAGETWTLSGGISGVGSLTANGLSTLILSGSNTYTGDTTVTSGTLLLNNANAAQNSVVTASGTGALRFGDASGTYNLGGLGGSTNLAMTSTSGSAIALTVGNNNASASYSGILSGGSGLTKVGTGTQVLSGTNTYAGGTTINAGKVIVSNAASLGSVSGDVTFSGNSSLQLGASFDTNRNTAINSGVTGTIDTNGFNQTNSGTISGAGSLSKAGSGTLALGASNSFTGDTVVAAGTLKANAANALGSTTSVTVASAGLLQISTSGAISDTAGITLSGGTILRDSGVSETMGNLVLTADSTLNYGSGTTGSLAFGTYTPEFLLSVTNFAPQNTLIFASDLRAIFASDYSSFFNFGGQQITSGWNGSQFTITAVPEPSTIIAGGLMLGVLLRRVRKKVRRSRAV